jgi:hypothetical protein
MAPLLWYGIDSVRQSEVEGKACIGEIFPSHAPVTLT